MNIYLLEDETMLKRGGEEKKEFHENKRIGAHVLVEKKKLNMVWSYAVFVQPSWIVKVTYNWKFK